MRRSALVATGAAAVGVVAGAIAFAVTSGGESDSRGAPATAGDTVRPEDCRGLAEDDARDCYARAFYELVRDEADPREAVAAIAESAWDEGGFLLANCHGVMHTVGRRYVESRGVTLATLMDVLPRSNDPGCTAGFAHGLVTGVAPGIDPADPRAAASACGEARTRYQRYSCTHGFGHAFMRINDGNLGPALELCRALGREAPDCAQGAYHDYWFAVIGVDDAELAGEPVTDPHALCATQPREYVRPCWYRAFVDTRPEGFQTQSPADFERLCAGLRGLQREACITAASVIGPPDPAVQLQLCAGLESGDAVACIRGTKVQNLLDYPLEAYVDLIRRCELFPAPATRTGCYRWLGKTLAVVTDGEFVARGCPQLATQARKACIEGARTSDGPLVTFS